MFVRSARKRALDLLISAAALTLGAPLLLLVAAAVKLGSRGPVLFAQRRVGLGGRPLVILKFRTMWHGASEVPHRDCITGMVHSPADVATDGIVTLTADDRVTKVGLVLRKTGLDELPQLWNVLKGEMTVVGPRPPLEYEVDLYESWQLERLSLKPGLTGLWQVSGRNAHSAAQTGGAAALDYVNMCSKDIEYARDWSFTRDVGIVLRTPWVMLTNTRGRT